MTQALRAQHIKAARQAVRDGQLGSAMALAQAVLQSHPNDLDALEIKALAEVERGEAAAAEQTLLCAIRAAPGRRWPYADLARLLLEQDRPDEAEAVAQSALTIDAANADAHAILGSLLTERLPIEAAGHFETAIGLVGQHPQLLLGLGRALLRQGKLQSARMPLQAAVAADPSGLEPLVALAELEEKCGRFDEATRILDRAGIIAVARGTDVDLQRSILLERMGKCQDALSLLETADKPSGAALLHRGRLLDQLGRHEEAWLDWTEGKAILAARSQAAYPVDEVGQEAAAMAAFFDSARMPLLPRARLRGGHSQPLFVLGFPRSGTTLTEQILASHSAVRAGGELAFVQELRDLAMKLAGGEANFPRALADHPNWPTLLRDLYLERAQAYGLTVPGSAWFTDKMPLNLMWLPLVRLAFPDSPVVLVRRHPLDVLISVMAHDMTHGFNCAYRLEDAAMHLALMDDLVARYSQAGTGPTHELQYERLIADQTGETQRLMASIGLKIEPSQLRFFEREAVSPTPSYAQVRVPLNYRSVGRWRNYTKQLAPIKSIVEKAIERGGYAG